MNPLKVKCIVLISLYLIVNLVSCSYSSDQEKTEKQQTDTTLAQKDIINDMDNSGDQEDDMQYSDVNIENGRNDSLPLDIKNEDKAITESNIEKTQSTDHEKSRNNDKENTGSSEYKSPLENDENPQSNHKTDRYSQSWDVYTVASGLKNPTDKRNPSNLEEGKLLYIKHCRSCHGSNGEGDGPKAEDLDSNCGDFTSEKFQSHTDGELFYKIKVGKDDMPSYKKKMPDETAIWFIVNYLRTME